MIILKIANVQGEAFILESATKGRRVLGLQPYEMAMSKFSETAKVSDVDEYQPANLGLLVNEPRQIFAVGMNFADHSAEIYEKLPKVPSIFTKFSSCLAPANTTVQLHGPKTDWETELVVVIGQAGRNISKESALDYVAGVTVGEDLSDRDVQFANSTPQFSMGKSFENYGVLGNVLTTLDEIPDLDNEVITTKLNGEIVQQAPLSQMIFKIQDLIAYLSSIVNLQPGDLIYTGTPSGTGVGRDQQVFLKPGDVLTGEITSLGQLTMTMA